SHCDGGGREGQRVERRGRVAVGGLVLGSVGRYLHRDSARRAGRYLEGVGVVSASCRAAGYRAIGHRDTSGCEVRYALREGSREA
nr:hypothetical protein [Tanacetum cinerariifolium]